MANRADVVRALCAMDSEYDLDEMGANGFFYRRTPMEDLVLMLMATVADNPGDTKANKLAECVLAAARRGEEE